MSALYCSCGGRGAAQRRAGSEGGSGWGAGSGKRLCEGAGGSLGRGQAMRFCAFVWVLKLLLGTLLPFEALILQLLVTFVETSGRPCPGCAAHWH